MRRIALLEQDDHTAAAHSCGECHPLTLKREGMAMTIVEGTRAVIGGVDTHLDVHVAAALDEIGGLLGVESFEASPAGNDKLLAWLRSFGDLAQVGVEGTGSYTASLARSLRAASVTVVEVDRPNRQARRRRATYRRVEDAQEVTPIWDTAPLLVAAIAIAR